MRPRRLGQQDYAARNRYFLTICTFQRRSYFTDPGVVELVKLEFRQTSTSHGFGILAYCYMPDHLHAVVEGGAERQDLPRFVRLAKQRSGFGFKRLRGERLWQESYFDRTLRRDEALPEVIQYVIANPVRARLVMCPVEYPYWGSELYSRTEILEFVSTESRSL